MKQLIITIAALVLLASCASHRPATTLQQDFRESIEDGFTVTQGEYYTPF